MTVDRMRALRELEGHQVSVAVRGGTRIDACQLASAGRRSQPSLWLVADGVDSFVPVADVVDVWEAA